MISFCTCNSVETAQPGDRATNPGIVMPECYASSQRVDSLARVVITPVRHTHTRLHTPPLKYLLVPEQPSTHSLVNFSCLPFTATLSPVFCTEVRPIGTALPVRRTVIGRQCNSVETAQPGDRATNPGIVMPECYASSQRVDSLARVVITPVRHTHTRLHTHYELRYAHYAIQKTHGKVTTVLLHSTVVEIYMQYALMITDNAIGVHGQAALCGGCSSTSNDKTGTLWW